MANLKKLHNDEKNNKNFKNTFPNIFLQEQTKEKLAKSMVEIGIKNLLLFLRDFEMGTLVHTSTKIAIFKILNLVADMSELLMFNSKLRNFQVKDSVL